MKKSFIFLCIITCLIILLSFYDNRTVSSITIDINPSIKINLNKHDKVKKVISLNEDGEKIITNNLKGKSYSEAINIVADNTVNAGFAKDNQIKIIVYSEGKVDDEDVYTLVKSNFEEKSIFTEVIKIDSISKEDEALAKKYNISSSKAAYINMIESVNENIPVDNLIDKSVSELTETMNTGYYCDEGYFLEGSHCLKHIDTKDYVEGDICPFGTNDYNGLCYEEGRIYDDHYYCDDDKTLDGDECIWKETIDAEPIYSCTTGELMRKSDVNPIGDNDNEKFFCVDKTNAVAPTLRCLTEPHIMINGECYVGPAPVINGGCPNNDTLVGGGCYSKDPGDQYVCPSGNIYEKSKDSFVELCPDTMTFIKPNIDGYKCPDGYTQENDKCINIHRDYAHIQRYCDDGFTVVNNEKCFNLTKIYNKEYGKSCPYPASRLENDKCYLFEEKEAYHN